MNDSNDKIHVIPLGKGWEVEAQSGASLAHEDSKEQAVETARQLARDEGVETVMVHDGDGVTEEMPPASEAARAVEMAPPAEEEELPDRAEPEPVAQIVHRGREMGF